MNQAHPMRSAALAMRRRDPVSGFGHVQRRPCPRPRDRACVSRRAAPFRLARMTAEPTIPMVGQSSDGELPRERRPWARSRDIVPATAVGARSTAPAGDVVSGSARGSTSGHTTNGSAIDHPLVDFAERWRDGTASSPGAVALTVAISCFNEEAIVTEHVREVLAHLRRTETSFELLISDDASTDRTAARLAELRDPELRVFRYDVGPSRRENLAKTLRRARGEVVAYMDMDLSSGLDRLPDLVGAVRSGRADIAVGSRRVPGSETQRGALRGLFSGAYNTAVRVLFASRIRDHQCGFKAMRRETLARLVDLLGYDDALRRGWFWDAELLIRAQYLGLRIVEIPVRWTEAAKSSFRFRQEILVARYMLQSWARIRRSARGFAR